MNTNKKLKKSIKIDGGKLKIAIVLPYFNEDLGLEMLKNAKEELLRNKVKPSNIKVVRVSGALEIPLACLKIIKKYKPDAIVALGVVIEGKTKHFDLVCETTYRGIMKAQLDTWTPISFGVLACKTEKQAKERVSKKGFNKGKDVALAALIQTTI